MVLQESLAMQIMEMDRLVEEVLNRNVSLEIRYGVVRLAMFGHGVLAADTLESLDSLHEIQIRQSVELVKHSLAGMGGKLEEGRDALNSSLDKIAGITMGGDNGLLILQKRNLQQRDELLQNRTFAEAITKEMMVELEDLSKLSIGIREKSISKSNDIVSASQSILLPVGIAMVVFVLFSSVYATRRLIQRILHLTQILDSLGEGKITQRLTLSARHDELDMIGKGINSMAERLFGILGKVSDVTQELSQSFFEMSAAIEEQAVVSSDQAAAVTEITATMEELSISSSQIAQHSKRVLDMSTKALDETTQGAVGVEMIMGKMVEITDENRKSTQEIIQVGKKSKDIVKVMNIINNIADQTKLIAFNAALEASSAGDAGRRFGVVAVEIRRLADTVMESIREIEIHISENQEAINNLVIRSEEGAKRVEEGMDLATKTAEMLIGIVDDVRSTSEASKQISLSTQQQKTASDQVLISLKEIGHGTRQSSAAIGQISGIVKGLNQMSSNLVCELNKFELKAQEEEKQPITGEPVREHNPYGTTPSIA
ncbi:MAG TPA: methyl-accepting chemotaxis protein [Magnetococcales bacterium]|nr:methyl-accepting chemotaxis protein [Magnetococcales bacterium]